MWWFSTWKTNRYFLILNYVKSTFRPRLDEKFEFLGQIWCAWTRISDRQSMIKSLRLLKISNRKFNHFLFVWLKNQATFQLGSATKKCTFFMFLNFLRQISRTLYFHICVQCRCTECNCSLCWCCFTFKLNVGLLCFLKLIGAPGYLKISLTIHSLSFLMGFNNF